MTAVAYSGQPEPPGWLATTVALLMGWLAAAVALLLLYVAASFVGAMSHPYDSWPDRGINTWPYYDSGLWSLAANLAVLGIALVLVTIATSWLLRMKHAPVSDARLAVLLVFVGGVPLVSPRPWLGLFGFLVALVLVRRWVCRREARLAVIPAAALLAALAAVVTSYGLLHPLWTTDVVPTASVGRHCSILVNVHNGSRVGVTVDRIDARSFTLSPARPTRLHLAAGGSGTILLRYLGGSGTAVFSVDAHYHVLGLALSEALPFRVQLRSNC